MDGCFPCVYKQYRDIGGLAEVALIMNRGKDTANRLALSGKERHIERKSLLFVQTVYRRPTS